MLADFPRVRRRLRYREYVALVQQGYFADEKLELIEGELIEMSPIGEPHMIALIRALRAIDAVFSGPHHVRPQGPLGLPRFESCPEPDLAVISGEPRVQSGPPTAALLVVEVADSSLTYDLGPKAALYAAGGVTEYWVVDIAARKLHVHRDPDATAGRYGSVRVVDEGGSVTPVLGTSAITVAALLP